MSSTIVDYSILNSMEKKNLLAISVTIFSLSPKLTEYFKTDPLPKRDSAVDINVEKQNKGPGSSSGRGRGKVYINRWPLFIDDLNLAVSTGVLVKKSELLYRRGSNYTNAVKYSQTILENSEIFEEFVSLLPKETVHKNKTRQGIFLKFLSIFSILSNKELNRTSLSNMSLLTLTKKLVEIGYVEHGLTKLKNPKIVIKNLRLNINPDESNLTRNEKSVLRAIQNKLRKSQSTTFHENSFLRQPSLMALSTEEKETALGGLIEKQVVINTDESSRFQATDVRIFSLSKQGKEFSDKLFRALKEDNEES